MDYNDDMPRKRRVSAIYLSIIYTIACIYVIECREKINRIIVTNREFVKKMLIRSKIELNFGQCLPITAQIVSLE